MKYVISDNTTVTTGIGYLVKLSDEDDNVIYLTKSELKEIIRIAKMEGFKNDTL